MPDAKRFRFLGRVVESLLVGGDAFGQEIAGLPAQVASLAVGNLQRGEIVILQRMRNAFVHLAEIGDEGRFDIVVDGAALRRAGQGSQFVHVLQGQLLVLLIDAFGALKPVGLHRGEQDQVLFLDACLVHLGIDLQDPDQPGGFDIGQLFGVSRQRVEAGFRDRDQSDGDGDENNGRDRDFDDQFEIVEETHGSDMTCSHRREGRAPPRRA